MRFETTLSELLDSEKLMAATVREQHKDIDNKTQGNGLSTTRSTSRDGNPQALTLYSLSEILQGVPAIRSDEEVMKAHQDRLDKIVGEQVDPDDPETPFKSLLDSPGLLPPAVRRQLELDDGATNQPGTAPATQPISSTAPAPGSGSLDPGRVVTSPGDVTWKMIDEHPQIPYMDAVSVVAALKAGTIDQRVLWVIKFLADNAESVWWTSGKRSGSGGSAHNVGRAADIRNRGGRDGITKPGDVPWVNKSFALLDSLTGPHRPRQIGGPHLPKPQNGTWKDGSAIHTDVGGLTWFTNAAHQNHIHIGY